LREAALGRPAAVKGQRVAIVGGGNVAVDAARTPGGWGRRRCISSTGAPVRKCRPTRGNRGRHEEGITFHFLNAPVRVLGSDRVTALEIQQQKLSEFDASGRRRPIPVKGAVQTLSVDVVIPAIAKSRQALRAGGWSRNQP